MKVLVDMDGVVADFVGGAIRLHGKPFPIVNGEIQYNFWEPWGMSADEFWRPMGREFWASLPVYDLGVRIMSLLSSLFGRQNLCFLTSPCRTAGCFEGKRDWVQKHYEGIPILFSSRGSDDVPAPKWFCASNDSLLVDDFDENVWSFVNAGGRAVLVPRPWNSQRHCQDPWREVEHAIKSHYYIERSAAR